MPRYEVPKFMGYGDAIQANQTMSSAFKDLSNTSQNFLNYSENQKQNAFDNQHKTDVLNETKNQNDLTNQHWFADYTAKQNDSETKNNQWQQDYQLRKDANTWDQDYKTKTFNHTVSQDNINNGFKQQQLNKPDYATFNGVDANGNPTLSMINKNNGSVINTGQQVYNEAKKLTPEQSMYYIDRTNEMKQKNTDALQKSLTNHPAYSKLSEEDKVKAYDYVSANGKLPEFKYSDGGWFGSEKYTIPMSEAVKQEKASIPETQNNVQQSSKPTLEEVGKQIDSLGSISTSPSYYNRNSRDLIKAKEWADGAGADHLRHVWLPTDKTKLEYYNLYGKGQGQ